MKSHSRIEVEELIRRGSAFLALIAEKKSLASNLAALKTWCSEVGELSKEVEAGERIDMVEGLDPIAEVFKGNGAAPEALAAGMNSALAALRRIIGSHSFDKPTEISVAKMTLFSRPLSMKTASLEWEPALNSSS